jgi:MFS family permease
VRKPFYGWIIVGVVFLIGATEAGTFQNILSVFLKPMVGEFGWSRAIVTGGMAFGSLCGGIISPFVGPILDRHGPRQIAFWSILIMSGGLASLSFLERIWQFYLFFGIGRMVSVGVLVLVTAVTVPNWFIRRRGRAMGIAMLGSRFGSILLLPFVQFSIFIQGWRIAWAALGGLIFLLSGIPSLIFLRRKPEDVGLFPDGELPATDITKDAAPAKEESSDSVKAIMEPVWTRSQAIRTPNFWLLTLLTAIIPFIFASTNFHLFPFLTDQGFTEMAGILMLVVSAIVAGLGMVVWGFLAERFGTQLLIAINFLIGGFVIITIFWFVAAGIPGITAALRLVIVLFLVGLYGIVSGGLLLLIPAIWAEFFGRAYLGSIYSLSSPFRWTANALGPIFTALCFDLFGSYSLAFHIFLILSLLSGILSLFMKAPKHAVFLNGVRKKSINA